MLGSFSFWVLFVAGGCGAGLVRVFDACDKCVEDGDNTLVCRMAQVGLVSVARCEGRRLITGRGMIVTGVLGMPSQAQLARTTLGCEEVNFDAILNGVKCVSTLFDVPRRASYGVYISQLIRFARVCNHVTDFNARNKCLTAKLLQQGYRYHKLRKTFSKLYRRHYELISKYNVGLKTLLSEGLSEPEFYGDLVYKFKKLIGSNDFSFQFRKIITRYRRIGYNLNVMRQSACLVFNPITVDNYAAFFNCTPVGRASDSTMAPKAIHFSWLGPELLVCCLAHRGPTDVFL